MISDPSMVPRRVTVEEFVSEGECLVYIPALDHASALNRSATEIWALCDGTKSIRSIVRTLADRYGLDEELLLDDIASTVSMLCERGLIELAGAPPPDA
jgi:hypothetical protein